jgi:dihydrolipoamide dehydrogenase
MADALKTQLLVLGAGPGGYPAAFHAADLGMEVTLVDRDPHPGGVCLYRGCIPSKALLHAAQVVHAARTAEKLGISFGEPRIDFDTLRAWKASVVEKLTSGLGGLTQQRGIRYVRGTARFTGPDRAVVALADGGEREIVFDNAVLATGSEPTRLPFVPDSPRVMDSTGALALEELPKRLLVMGGGYIGLELGQVYATFGCEVTVVEMKPSLLPGVDPDLVKPLAKVCATQFRKILLNTSVTAVAERGDVVQVGFRDAAGAVSEESFDRVLVAVGRRPVTQGLGLDAAGVRVTPQGFVQIDEARRTTSARIYAVGDIAGPPMLAHKATHEGRSAVEAIHGGKAVYDPRAIPAVVFTDPEIAWCGLTEDEARKQGRDVRIGLFPWQASGRAATLDRPDGVSKIVADAETGLVLGVGVAGHGAGELIGEGVVAIEMGATAEDLALSVHAHPSLSETIMEAAERVTGQSTHFFQRKKIESAIAEADTFIAALQAE